MRDKLERSLGSFDTARGSHADDQKRRDGHVEVPAMTLGVCGPVRHFCTLGHPSTVACTTDRGPIWVLNWRDGCVVSKMRDPNTYKGDSRSFDGPVSRLCVANSEHSLLASGDEYGYVSLWNLTVPVLEVATRLHEGRVTGLQSEWEKQRLITTATDTYINLYDLQHRQVVERALPKSGACGSGIPNSVLTVGNQRCRNLLFVGAADGKMRVWTKDQGPLTRQYTLSCGAGQPTQCAVLNDGFHVLVATEPGQPGLCGGRSDKGGLLLFDLRRLGNGYGEDAALIARHDCFGLPPPESDALIDAPIPSGVIDMTLVEDDGERIAFCIMDGAVSAFNVLGDSGALTHKFDFDILGAHDRDVHGRNYVCALAAAGRCVFTATTAPSLGVWWQPDPKEPYGHNQYVREPPPPLQLKARYTPLPSGKRAVTSGRPPTSIEKLEEALEQDRKRLLGVPRMREPFEPFVPSPDGHHDPCTLPCCRESAWTVS